MQGRIPLPVTLNTSQLGHHSVNEILTDQNYLIFRYFILFWHAICWQVATNKNLSFFGPIFYLEFCWYCAGIPAPGPPLFIQELSKCHVILASSYWSDAKCDAHFLFKLASRLKFSHRISPHGCHKWYKKMLGNKSRWSFEELDGHATLTAKRQPMETSVWENSL